ncbi:hypothetical protein [Enterococcus faecium]|nr:hypothetical protein [Enterococcus faecium]
MKKESRIMIVMQTLYKMKKKRGMFMENEQSVVLTELGRSRPSSIGG